MTETEKGFVVKWEDEEKQCERQFNKDNFHFFSRGDLPKTDSPHTINPEHNNALAKCFATQALKLEGPKRRSQEGRFFSWIVYRYFRILPLRNGVMAIFR